jgi:hypothetical protein
MAPKPDYERLSQFIWRLRQCSTQRVHRSA